MDELDNKIKDILGRIKKPESRSSGGRYCDKYRPHLLPEDNGHTTLLSLILHNE